LEWLFYSGAAVGAAAIEGLHAQAKPSTYVVVAIRSIKDADAFKSGVVDKATPGALAAAGGHFGAVSRADAAPAPSMKWKRQSLR
jgi:hypothetical protein